MSIKVSIITPCLNSERTIRNTIESVLKQTYENIEYIIVDGASSDETISIVKEYIPFFHGKMRNISEKDKGIYDAMNKGIMQASGDLIGIINSDDWYESDAVEQAVRCFEDTDADVVYGEMWIIDENGNREYHTIHSLFPPHPSVFIRRELYQKYGMFDTKYRIAADRDLLLRFMAKEAQFQRVDKIFANFRRTGISNKNILLRADETYEINLKYLGKCPGNILNKDDIEESYNRSKLVYVSEKNPQAINGILSKMCDLSDGVIIFGAGNCGIELETILRKCNVRVLFFVDNDERKWGLEKHGVQIYSPEILGYCRGHVIITTTRHQRDISWQLRDYSNAQLKWSTLEEIRNSVITQCFDLISKQEMTEAGRG